jgi:hypothetical protein
MLSWRSWLVLVGWLIIAVGAAQILYGILALVILIQKGSEFSRPRV